VENDAPATFPLGETTVTWTVTDDTGNTATATQKITVEDNEAPTITAPADLVIDSDPGSCDATDVSLGNSTTSDNCGVASVENDAPATFPLGETTVTWTVTDNAGNTNTAAQIITVEDNEKPTASNPAPINVQCAADVPDPDPSVVTDEADNCTTNPTLAFVSDSSDGNNNPEIIIRTYSVTDEAGNSIEVTQEITVDDTIDPTASNPTPINVQCAADVPDPDPSAVTDAADNCTSNPIVAFVSDSSDGNFNPEIITRTYSLTDEAGNSIELTQKITVKDTQPPTIPELPDLTSECPLTVTPPTTTDNCDGAITGTTGLTELTFDASETIYWYFTDASGNKIGPIEQEVIIDNTVAPVPDITTLPKETISGCQISGISELTIPTATDACEGTISGTLSEDFQFPYSFFGTNSITWEYIDSQGNISTQEQKIELVPETIDGGTIEGTFLSSTFQDQIDISACGDEISIDLELSGQIGTIVHWEKFAVNRGIWEIINNTSNSHTASFEEGGLESTYYRALVEVGSCSAYSESFYVRALPAGDAPTVTNLDDSDKYCLDDEVSLRATSNYSATQPAIPSDKAPGDFNQGQLNTQDPDSWLVDGDPGGFTAGGDSKKARNWSGTNDHEFGDITYDGGDGKFAIAQGNFYETKNNGDPLYDGDVPTTLESPILDLSNAGSASLDFDQAFYFADGDIALIEVSIDGGETYSLLREMHAAGTGVKKWFTAGTAASVSGSTTTEYNFKTDNTSISLEDYIGESNVRIRWSFTGTSDKSVWAMDNIFVNKEVPVDTELEWTIGIGNPEEEPIETGETNVDITFTPQSPGIHQYGGTALINGCRTYGEEGTDLIDIYVSYAYAGEDIKFTEAECGRNTVQLNAYDNTISANENAAKDAYPSIPEDCKTCDNPGTGEIGTWSWAGATPTCKDVSFSDINDPNATFTAGPGTYTLTWTVDGCSSDMIVTINDCDQVDFDGVDDHVDFNDNYNLSGDFSLEVWVKPESKNGLQTIFSKRDGNFSDPAKGYDLRIEDGIVSFNWDKSGTIASPEEINTNRWYHIAVTHSAAGEYKLYIDGVEVKVDGGGSPGDNDYNAILGAMDGNEPGDSSNYFNGWMEELRIWNAALTQDQIHLMMNQRIKKANTNEVEGEEIPILVDNLKWDDLIGYYRMDDIGCGNMNSHQGIGVHGKLKNITSPQERTAPLPYIAAQAGNWWDTNTWKEPLVWDPPSSPGITGDTIAWNIVRLNNKLVHNPASTNNSKSIDLLALLDEGGTLDMQGANNTSGNGLTITHYFKLDGILDLNGESQLIQSEGSEVLGSGHIERDQQGTASSFNYNYWSSPVLPSNSSTYTVAGVMFDGTDLGTNNFKNINFGDRYAHADGPLSSPIKISNYWINAFRKRQANEYSQWERIGSNPTDAAYFLKPGEGYTMKGTYWVSVKQNKLQNYTFKGFPNNGDIELTGISADQNYLIGNPYPSAVNAVKFIEGHLKNTNPSIGGNVFNGTIYYWDHYSGQTHYLEKYVGGYAAFNLSGGLRALSNDNRINFESDEEGTKTPGPYIPVGQGFFINTASGDSDAQTNTNITGGTVKFKNEYRVFASEANKSQSQFLSPESLSKQKAISANKMQKDNRYKIRLQFNSPTGYIRELLVTADRKSTNGYDLGYDALLLDNSEEDMYWMINEDEFIIQAVPHFNMDQVLPLGLKIAEESEFSIKIKELENIPKGMNIYLKDKIDDSYFNLTQADFKASLPPEIHNERYEIVFNNGEEPEEEVEHEEESALTMGYSYNSRELHIKNPEMLEIHKLVIYSISGQEVHSFLEVPTSKLISLELDKPLSSAVYVVRAYTNKGIIATQVIIKQ
ncbi:LamG-like jellyroll fold domain-containing protein, partial [Salegentibacter sediminis]|uniref:LamG-like jellyroll fold domain-containing protein n=1 Tax=Salegentibacter sediminis TaxID=1930251 RepID=UPI0012FFA718